MSVYYNNTPMSFRIISYNLLVPDLAEEHGYFYKCDPRYLHRNYRLPLIQNELYREMTHHNNTIICLQELCRSTVPLLKQFFRQYNYILIHKLYGEKHNDYMGVGIAIPNSMRPNSVRLIKVGDKIRAMLNQKGADSWQLRNKFRGGQRGNSADSSSDSWDTAMHKSNILIFVQVMIHGVPLCIGTYHMPCLFKDPDVMLIHATAVKEIMFDLAKGHNMVLAGDFNTKPTDGYYRAITERGYASRYLPKSTKYKVVFRPNSDLVLRSAYVEGTGTEPRFTTFSSTPGQQDFCDTLDYIFFQGRLVVERVLPLPNYLTSQSYPDATHPSDHLMIAATFRLY